MVQPDTLTALVTGGSSGIGKAVCEHFLAKGYRVLSLSRRPSPLKHVNLVDIKVDLTDIEDLKRVIGQIEEYSPTTLVLNAGASLRKETEDLRVEDVERQLNLAITSSVLLTQACLSKMRQAQFGRIVLISSRVIIGQAGVAVYSAAKAAQVGLARCWAMELGPSGITVNVIAPGPIKTEIFDTGTANSANIESVLASNLPVRRMGFPDDIARAVIFLTAPENGFVTGQTLFVCGGASLGGVDTLGIISAAMKAGD